MNISQQIVKHRQNENLHQNLEQEYIWNHHQDQAQDDVESFLLDFRDSLSTKKGLSEVPHLLGDSSTYSQRTSFCLAAMTGTCPTNIWYFLGGQNASLPTVLCNPYPSNPSNVDSTPRWSKNRVSETWSHFWWRWWWTVQTQLHRCAVGCLLLGWLIGDPYRGSVEIPL